VAREHEAAAVSATLSAFLTAAATERRTTGAK